MGHDDGYAHAGGRPFESVPAVDPSERESILAFFRSMPLVLERSDLRVVHACFDAAAVAALPEDGDLVSLARAAEARTRAQLRADGTLEAARRERREFAGLVDPQVRPTRMLEAARTLAMSEQLGSPYRVITSGLEAPLELEDIFFVGGKWRLVDRVRWWDSYTDAPAVVCGHYWRRRQAPDPAKRDLWGAVPPLGWAGPHGNVFCVDYSVGRRFAERWAGREHFAGGLAALRWPERTLVFDDESAPRPTTGFGG